MPTRRSEKPDKDAGFRVRCGKKWLVLLASSIASGDRGLTNCARLNRAVSERLHNQSDGSDLESLRRSRNRRCPMPFSRPRKIRARRSRRTVDQSGRQTEGLSNVSGSNLVYAGYPYDPYA